MIESEVWHPALEGSQLVVALVGCWFVGAMIGMKLAFYLAWRATVGASHD